MTSWHSHSGTMKKLPKKFLTPTEPIPAGEVYLTKEAVAKRLGVKPKTVSDWANAGKLPAYRVGVYLRFKWAEIEAHLTATCKVANQGGAL